MKFTICAEGLTPQGMPIAVTGHLDCGPEFAALQYVTVRDVESGIVLTRISCVPWFPRDEPEETEEEESEE